MTTLAIIGGGIAGRSLIYALAKKKNTFSKVTLFDSECFAPACSFHSTAIVASRGVTEGHSALGDLLVAGYKTFKQHVLVDKPLGVFSIKQFSAASKKIDHFKIRYPLAQEASSFGSLNFNTDVTMAEEEAYLIDPTLYMEWLFQMKGELNLEVRREFVTEYQESENGVELTVQNKEVFKFDKVIFCGGSYNRFWNFSFTGRPVHGAYLEFSDIHLESDSFSLTFDSDNLIYQSHSRKLLIGSTTLDSLHLLASELELHKIYHRLQSHLSFALPPISSAIQKVGLREKASKRAPYIQNKGHTMWLGGLYKNGYSLSLHLAQQMVETFL